MLIISRDQAFERWDTLPENLREALFDDVLAATLWSVCEKNHLSEERTQAAATVAGDVLMGFLHPEPTEVSREIAERAGIPKQVASVIAEELYRKIFLPFKIDLEKNYSPVNPPSASPAFPSPPVEESAEESEKTMPTPFEISAAARDTDAFSIPHREPPRASSEPLIATDILSSDKIKDKLPVAGDVRPLDNAQDNPFILHEEKEFVSPAIPRTRPSITFDAPSLSRAPAPPSKPVIARVETPDAPEKKDQVRVVHYSNMKTPLKTDAKDAK